MVYDIMCVFEACRTKISIELGYMCHLLPVRIEIMLLFGRVALLYFIWLLLFGIFSKYFSSQCLFIRMVSSSRSGSRGG
jgi:hypothetical protein